MKTCETCGGSGVVMRQDWHNVPCGYCDACQRGDPAGCWSPVVESVEEEAYCDDCQASGIVDDEISPSTTQGNGLCQRD